MSTPTPAVDLAEQDAEDSEEILIAWLEPLRRTGNSRVSGDPLPFTIVTQVGGTENADEGTAAPIVSVHTLVDKTLGRLVAKNEARLTHKRVLRLSQHCDPVTLSDGRTVGVDYVDVVESPLWLAYGDDQILRKVGRYELGLTYVPSG
jgi:hypothetical protein